MLYIVLSKPEAMNGCGIINTSVNGAFCASESTNGVPACLKAAFLIPELFFGSSRDTDPNNCHTPVSTALFQVLYIVRETKDQFVCVAL